MHRPVHFEIHAADPQRAMAFYGDLFGWEFSEHGGSGYMMIATGEGPGIHGGLMRRIGPEPDHDGPIRGAVVTMETDDIDGMIERVVAAGGKVALDKMAVPGVGWVAYFEDTERNIFGLMQADEGAK